MKTNFFSQLANIENPLKLSITVTIDKDQNATVTLLPLNSDNGDSATKKITPLNLCGTLEELDNAFFQTVAEPIKQTTTFFANTNEYLANKAEAEKNSQAEKDKKDKIKKLVEELDKITKADDYDPKSASGNKALLKAQEIKSLEKDNKNALNAIEIITKATAQKAMF